MTLMYLLTLHGNMFQVHVVLLKFQYEKYPFKMSVLKMFGDYFKYSDRLTYTAKVLSLRSMKDQIPYLTKVHELRGKFRCVHTGDL